MPSTVIRRFEYDPQRRELHVTFQSGRRYRYLGVPAEVHASMKHSFSKGEFFNAHIRDRFEYVREE